MFRKFLENLGEIERLKSFRPILGFENQDWARVVMNRNTQQLIEKLEPQKLKVLEISGSSWENRGFISYKSLEYPNYDVCEAPLNETFDLIIAEQVFEHLTRPYKAGKNVFNMLNRDGRFLITLPFLIRVHDYPIDCSRWTQTGLKYFLEECGFSLECIQTYSWGNRECINSNFTKWTKFNKYLHNLDNEPDFPIVVWGLAKKI